MLYTTFYVLFIFLTFLIYYSTSPTAQVGPNYTNRFAKVSFCTICSIVHMTHTVSADTENSSSGGQTRENPGTLSHLDIASFASQHLYHQPNIAMKYTGSQFARLQWRLT